MIKTWLIDALRNIKNRIVSWLSIVTIVFIGTTLILGLFFGSATVKSASLKYIQAQNFRDIDVACTLGVKEDDIQKIKEFDQVKDAEGQISFSAVASYGKANAGITVLSATERISIPTVTEGRLPSTADECAVSLSAIGKLGASVGDEIEITVSSARFEDILANKKYRITGIASHPDYMVNISTDYAVLTFDAFYTKDLSFDYSNILVDADIAADPFKNEYRKSVSNLEELLRTETASMADARIQTMSQELDKEYDNARKKADEELAKGKSELDKGLKLFNDTIKEAKEQLDKGELDLNDLKSKAEKELAEAKKKIKDGEEEYKKQLADGQAQLEQAEKDMESELENARWQLFDGFLQIDKNEKLLNEKEAEYQRGLQAFEEGEEQLKKAREELDAGWALYEEGISQLDGKLSSETVGGIAAAVKALSKEPGDKADVISGEIDALKDLEPYERATGILELYDTYMSENVIEPLKEKLDELFGIDDFRNKLDDIARGKALLDEKSAQYADGKRMLEDAKEELEEGRKLLDQGWFSLAQAKQKLADGQAEFAKKEPEARQKLEDAKKEFEEKKAEGAQQLEDARKTLSSKTAEAGETIKKLEEDFLKAKEEFATKKADGQKEVDDATSKYEEAKKEAEDKLSEVRAQIDEAKDTPCRYVVRTRDVNAPYVQTRSFIKALSGFFIAFTPLYAAIIAVVCFFTMTIIIEEQTSQIGTCKAFGMREHEIMRKYIVFGATGALIGALAGVVGAFQVEERLTDVMKNNMAFPLTGSGHNIGMIVLLPVIEVLITVAAVVWSCHRYIRCTAVGLISGNEPVKKYRTKSARSGSGSLYTNLIMNNLVTDIGREVVSVVTIVMCVFIVGFGIDLKLAYEGALKRQMNDIWQYDLTLTESGKITDEEKEAVKQALSSYDALYLQVGAGVIVDGDTRVLTSIICVDDPEEFKKFYVLKDYYGKDIDLTDDGMLVTREMEEKNELRKGDTVRLTNRNLNHADATINGIFLLYAGKTIIMTDNYYNELYGSDRVANTYYIKAPEADKAALKESLEKLPGVSSVELTSNLRDRNLAVVNMYNAVVIIVILFSVLLSFMILLNLSNILVAHRMREILTMRVNGFSNGQVIGYLVREVMMVDLLAFVIALALGISFTGFIMQSIETDAFMFVREPFALAWTASVLINTLFSVVINCIAFRRVNKVPLTDINKY